MKERRAVIELLHAIRKVTRRRYPGNGSTAQILGAVHVVHSRPGSCWNSFSFHIRSSHLDGSPNRGQVAVHAVASPLQSSSGCVHQTHRCIRHRPFSRNTRDDRDLIHDRQSVRCISGMPYLPGSLDQLFRDAEQALPRSIIVANNAAFFRLPAASSGKTSGNAARMWANSSRVRP